MAEQPATDERRLAWLLSAVAGYVDTCGFMALFGLFTAHVTGNFVLIGASLSGHSEGLAMKLLALPVFVVVVGAVTLAVRASSRAVQRQAATLMAVQAAVLALFMGLGIAGQPFASPSDPLALATGVVGVAAMSLQNAGTRLLLSSMAPSTVMTGNVTQVVIDLVSLRTSPVAGRDAARARARKLGEPVLCFALSAVAGGWGITHFGFVSLIVPVILLGAASVRATRSKQ